MILSRTYSFLLAAVLLSALLCAWRVEAKSISCAFTTQRTQCGDLACDAVLNICVPCQAKSDCFPNAMKCNTDSGTCVVRSFFGLFGWRTVVSMFGSLAVCAIAVLAGVGGGGILVPMFTGLIQIPMQTAVGLSQSTICGQSTLNMYLAVQKKFPDATWDRPLINYQYLSLLLPLGLIGTLIGGLLSKICPDFLRLVLLFVLLSAVLYRTVVKMMKQYKSDKVSRDVTVEASVSPTTTAPSSSGAADNSTNQPAAPAATTTPAVAESRSPLPQYPTFELGANFACFFLLLVFNIVRTLCQCGGFWYWCCVLLPLCTLGGVFYYSRQRLEKLSAEQPQEMSFVWNTQNSITYPLVAVVAGAAAAMLGIGGGLVLGFVLYEVGLVPEEASVTGGMATFFISFSSALQLLVTRSLIVDFGIVFFGVGLCSTALGQFVFMKYIKQHGLNYLIVGSLAAVIGGSLLVLGGYGIYNAVSTARTGGSITAFGQFCA